MLYSKHIHAEIYTNKVPFWLILSATFCIRCLHQLVALLIKECHQLDINLTKFCGQREPFLDVLQWLLSMPKGWPPITARPQCTGSAAHAQKPQNTNTSSKRRICGRRPLSCNAMMCCNDSCQCPGADYLSQQHADSACTEASATTWHHQHCMAHLAHGMLCLRLWLMHKTLHEPHYTFCTVLNCVSKRWNAAFWVHCACSVNLKHIHAWCHVPVYELGPRTHLIMIPSLSCWCCAHHVYAWCLWNNIHIQISNHSVDCIALIICSV